MKTHGTIVALSTLTVGIIIGSATGGGLLHQLVFLSLWVTVALPVLILTAPSLLRCLKHKERTEFLNWFSSTGAVGVLAILGFTIGGVAIFHYRENEVRRFVEEMLPLLDAYKAENGQFPLELSALSTQRMPYYFRKAKCGYHSDGKDFRFYYENPDAIMGGVLLTHRHRTWSVAD
jgi:hypothetical protein